MTALLTNGNKKHCEIIELTFGTRWSGGIVELGVCCSVITAGDLLWFFRVSLICGDLQWHKVNDGNERFVYNFLHGLSSRTCTII